jgi:hypothetical protein
MLSAKTSGLKNLEKTLKVEKSRHKKAFYTALRVRGFRLMGLMKKEIREGAPGGKRFAPLSTLARRTGTGNRLRPDKPLSRLAIAVRYYVARREPMVVSVGFTHPKLSKSWQRIALRQQQGFKAPLEPDTRAYFLKKASELGVRAKGRRHLFLRRGTKEFRTPARPIISPFWRAHKDESMRKIRRDFKRKLRGERI